MGTTHHDVVLPTDVVEELKSMETLTVSPLQNIDPLAADLNNSEPKCSTVTLEQLIEAGVVSRNVV